MQTYSWSAGASGDWNTATDWTGGAIPNSSTADVVIDVAPAAGTTNYVVTISAGESETVDSILLNGTVNAATLAGTLEVDGTLTLAPGSAGLIGGPLQNEMIVDNGTIVNAGTINAFVQTLGDTTFTGTNGVYITNWLQSQGETTIDTTTIGEYADVAPNTLSDGIFEADGTAAVVNLGGSVIATGPGAGSGGLIVNIETVQGPGTDYSPGLAGYTQLIWDGPVAVINEWNGTAYVPVQSSITTIQNNATITVNDDGVTGLPGNYTTTNTLTIGSTNTTDLPALFYEQGGTLTTAGLTIDGNGTLSGAPTVVGNVVNNGTVMASGGEMILQGSVTGTGVLTFDTTAGVAPGTLDVQTVAAGETVALLGSDELIIESPTNFKGTVSDAGVNTVTLVGLVANSGTWTGGTLDLYNSGSLVDAIAMTGSAATVSVSTTGTNTTVTLGGTVISTPPVLTAGASVSYAAGGAATALDAALTITDAEAATLIGATVNISAGFLAGDTLSATAQTGITSSYDAATGALTLTGTASLAAYQAELDSVTFVSTAADPTSGGTDTSRTISWEINDGEATATAISSLSASAPVVGVGSQILFQNNDGQLAQWQVSETTVTASSDVGPNLFGTSWFSMATGAFFSGDTSDIVSQSQSGLVAVWEVNNGNALGGYLVNADPGPAWQIKGTGDFYGDGNTDILWQNQNGLVDIWEMQGANIIQNNLVAADPGPAWQIKGTGDFYGDGNTDILWQNQDGLVDVWDMQGATIVQNGLVAADPGPAWRIVGTGDFYGDGNTDILWRNDDGLVDIWDMKGANIVQNGLVAADPGPTWHVVGTGNYFGDGDTDIVWQNDNGLIDIWDMKGTDIVQSGIVGSAATWNIIENDQMRFIYSESANETLTATPTMPDEFVFTDAAAGAHTITGFKPTQDIIELNGAEFASFAAVQAATSAAAGGAMINLGNGGSLFLSGVDPTMLHASNFALT
jgi:hypothetical protein